jgi:hypothetical protein
VVVFAFADVMHGSGFLAVYIAGLVVGNSTIRAHNTIVTFLDAATWLAQIAMFVLLGLLAWPSRLPQTILPALAVAATLMLVARPAAVFLCLAPYPFNWREKLFMSWVGLRGAVGIFIASIPLLVGLPNAQLYFDVGFVVVLVSLLVQGWTIGPAARWLRVAFPRSDPLPRRVELDLPGQLEQEIVGYPISANSPYLRRGLLPTWARPTLVVRDERILSPSEAAPVRDGDYIYLLAPPERAQALDRFFVDMPPPAGPDPLLLGDFFVTGDHTLGELAEIYGLSIAPEETGMALADFIAARTVRMPRAGDVVPIGTIALVVHRVTKGRVASIGLRLAEELEPEDQPAQDRDAAGVIVGHHRLDAEHRCDPFRRQHRARRAFGDKAAAVHDHDAVGEARGEREVVHDGEDGAAVLRGAGEQLHHHELMARIERHRRFVGEQHRRFAGERARQRHPRPFAARQRGHRPRGEAVRGGGRERTRDGGAVGVGQRREGIAVGVAAERHHGGDRHRPVEDMALRQIGDVARTLARGQRRERLAVDLDAAFGGQKPGQRAHQRGLAGAVRADQHGQFAGAQVERRAVDH